MQERRQDALNLNSRVAVLENVVADISDIKRDVNEILVTMAEQRGAAKAIKIIYGIAMTALGFLGGLFGGAVRHL